MKPWVFHIFLFPQGVKERRCSPPCLQHVSHQSLELCSTLGLDSLGKMGHPSHMAIFVRGKMMEHVHEHDD